MTDLQKTQADLARSSFRLLFAGAAFLSFGVMAAKGLAGLVETSSRGSRIVGDFKETFDRLKSAIGARIVDKFGETLVGWIDKIQDFTTESTNLTADIVITLGLGSIAIGATLTAAAIAAGVINQLIGVAAFLKLISATTAATATGAVLPAILSIVIAVVLTMAIAKIVWQFLPQKFKEGFEDLAAQAQAFADESGVPVRFGQKSIAFPEGTQAGMFSPRGGFTGAEIIQNTNLFIETLNTEADLEELGPYLSEVIADNMTNYYGGEEIDPET